MSSTGFVSANRFLGVRVTVAGQVSGGRHGAGVDVLWPHVDGQAMQPRDHVPPRPLAIVGEESEKDIGPSKKGH
jgi:hypothetical protein